MSVGSVVFNQHSALISEKEGAVAAIFLWIGRLAVVVLVGLLLFLAWLVEKGDLYEPGSDFGYNLGLVGGVLMLSLLFYSVRKRFFPHDRFGQMEHWFRYHMFIGVASPVLILFHSTFQTGSINGAFAFYSMLSVALSGVIGRFIYRHVHQGMYGKHMTLADVRAELKASSENMGSVFALQPDIEERLQRFQTEAFEQKSHALAALWHFLTLAWRGDRLSRAVRADAKRALHREWEITRGPTREFYLNYRLAREQIQSHIESVIKAAQFTVWEKLFSIWHLVHVPFLYLLVFSGIVHVVAVHMY